MGRTDRGVRVLADQIGVTERYIGRILKCAVFAPTIVEAIVDGRQPSALMLKKLKENVPLAWSGQVPSVMPE